MSAEPTWLYMFAEMVDVLLMTIAYTFGLVVALRRWHLGNGARLAAAGFVLQAVTLIGSQLAFRLLSFADLPSILWQYTVLLSLVTLLNVTGIALIVLGLRSALQEVSRLRAEPHPLRETDLR